LLNLRRTNSEENDFINLVFKLDEYLHVIDGDKHPFFAQFNKLDSIKNVIVAYEDEVPVGCGAIKKYIEDTMEVKRMYVKPEARGKGIGRKILNELEIWTLELNYNKCILETSKKLIEAVRLYKNSGYNIIPNYGQYKVIESSICFEKKLR